MRVDALESQMCIDLVRRDDAMRTELAKYVAIPTGQGNTPGLDEFRGVVGLRLHALGAMLETIPGDPKPAWLGESGTATVPPTLVARGPAGNGPRVLISGHLDTVFNKDSSFRSLTIAPDGKRATGPGVVDMKGGILIALEALEALKRAGVALNWTVIFNSDEETGTYHSDRALRAEARRHDFGIALEPATPPAQGSDAWGLVTSRKGSGSFMVEVRGRTAHAGRDFEKGVSAVYGLARVLTTLEAMSDIKAGVTVNVGPVRCTQPANVVPDYAAAWGNVRYPDEPAAQGIKHALESLSRQGDALPGVQVSTTFNRPAKPEVPRSRSLAEFIRASASDLDQQLTFTSTGGVCDGNNLQAEGLPTIDTLGVRGGGLHTEQEWIDLSSLVERAQLLAVVLKRLQEGRLQVG